jgi:hypothetical protein
MAVFSASWRRLCGRENTNIVTSDYIRRNTRLPQKITLVAPYGILTSHLFLPDVAGVRLFLAGAVGAQMEQGNRPSGGRNGDSVGNYSRPRMYILHLCSRALVARDYARQARRTASVRDRATLDGHGSCPAMVQP